MSDLFTQYDNYEDSLVTELLAHPFFTDRQYELSNEEYIQYLLQLGHFSMSFINWLITALVFLEKEDEKEIVRDIIGEEVPRHEPAHQELRIQDMYKIGVATTSIAASIPSKLTLQSIAKRYELISKEQPNFELCSLITLRLDGEVFASEVFHQAVLQIEKRFGVKAEDLKYYTPHYLHDRKGGTGDYSHDSHSDHYAKILSGRIKAQQDLDLAKEQVEKTLEIRSLFHDQF